MGWADRARKAASVENPEQPKDEPKAETPENVQVVITVGPKGILNVQGPLSPRDMLAVLQEATSEVIFAVAAQKTIAAFTKAQRGVRPATALEAAKLKL